MRIAEIFELGHSSGYDRYGSYSRGRSKKDGDRGRRRFGRKRRRRGGLISISIL